MSHAEILKEACDFVGESVFLPALQSPGLSERAKNVVRDSAKWLKYFERVGDLYTYLQRCIKATEGAKTYETLRSAGLKSYEDILPEFERRFADLLSFKTTAANFRVGHDYSTFQLVIFAERYEPRSGGIFPIGELGMHSAVVVKATLSGGKYQNEWIEKGRRLKYFLKSRQAKGADAAVFDERYVENRAIIEYPNIPVLVFARQTSAEIFTFFGAFCSAGVHRETDGSKWFELALKEADFALLSREQADAELQKQVEISLNLSSEERRKRLSSAPKLPLKRVVLAESYVRSADVIVEVLKNAAGVCECCGKPAPFLRNSNGTPYLEVHHLLPLAEGGEDTIENAAALCPNCHRGEHHGPVKLAKAGEKGSDRKTLGELKIRSQSAGFGTAPPR